MDNPPEAHPLPGAARGGSLTLWLGLAGAGAATLAGQVESAPLQIALVAVAILLIAAAGGAIGLQAQRARAARQAADAARLDDLEPLGPGAGKR